MKTVNEFLRVAVLFSAFLLMAMGVNYEIKGDIPRASLSMTWAVGALVISRERKAL